MTRNRLLNLTALNAMAAGSPVIKRDLLLLYLGTAERCLRQMQALVVSGGGSEWKAVVQELGAASRRIHATQLAVLCTEAADAAGQASTRMAAYIAIKDAYAALLAYLQTTSLLVSPDPG